MLRRWYAGLSLRTKATAITLVITTLSLSAVAGTGIVQIRRQVAAEQQRSADSVALGMARASELALVVGDVKELAPLAAGFLRDETILFVAIYGKGERPLASAVRDRDAWQHFLGGRADPDRWMLAQRPVEAPAQSDEFSGEAEADPLAPPPAPPARAPGRRAGTAGRVVVALSTAPSTLAQQRQVRATVVATTSAAGVGAVALFITLGASMRRLQRLADASQSLSRGDFSATVSDRHDDEIGRLSRSFDAMRLALRERDRDLRHFADTLQAQVGQRTADLERALAAAEEANRAKSLFLANMSHELRTPLNGVIGMVDLLLAAEPDQRQRRYCDVAKSSAHSLLELINDILDFSKIEAGKLELDLVDFDLHQAVEGVTQMLGERAEKKGLELACSVGKGVPRTAGGDPVRLRQVIVNLVSNAIKFTERGEVVFQVALEAETDAEAMVRFAVRDTGVGIPADRIDRLFKSFSQADASTTRRFGGTGLGLAISQRIAEMMGGRIGVESQPGRGSTFWFTARLQKRAVPVPAQPAEARVDPRGLRVLAVDDNQTNREILHAQLESWALRPDLADSAVRAVEMLHAAAREGRPYRFALLDMHMPDTDGLQLARLIKADPLTRDVVLISLSSIGDAIRPQEMTALGFSACLTKPLLPSCLYNAIVDSLAAQLPGGGGGGDGGKAREPDRAVEALPASGLAGVRVLLAEDNEVNRIVASELLKQFGCECTVAVNGREAMERALAGRHDVILMDCQMPEMDGFEATRRIREAEASGRGGGVHRPIVALTANAIKGDRELCLESGMDGYVTKPIEPEQLLKAIRAVLPAGVAAAHDDAAHAGAAPAPPPPAAGPDANPPVSPPVDVESLRRRCLGNRRLAAKALTTFDATVSSDLRLLAEGVQRRDAGSVAASAHKIKGAAASTSVEEVRRLAAELEQLAKDGEMDAAQASLDRLGRELARFHDYLATALGSLTPAGEGPGAASAAPRPG